MTVSQFWNVLARDFRLLEGHLKVGVQLKWLDVKGATVGKVFDEYAKKNPDKICFYFKDEKWTYRMVEETSNRLGNYFAEERYRSGQIISLLMHNRPEYVCAWLGLSKVGVITALINYNLRSQPLRHCLEVAKSEALICGGELTSAVAEIEPELKNCPVYVYGETKDTLLPKWKNLDSELPKASSKTPEPKDPKPNFRSSLFYCYTSGTTGLPKAAVITNSRFFMSSYVNHYASELTKDDIIYETLPLYHVAGGALGLSQTLIWGNPMVLKDKFSASTFWKDCYLYKATAAQYIAETCRFLLQAEESEWDKKHKVRLMFGNGFRTDIWEPFVKRFGIQKVTEYYASTEGNANLVNYDSTSGAVGMIPPWMEKLYPIALVKVDEETGDLIRDPKTGRLIRCKPGEVGELIGKIVINSPLRDFKGYAADKQANEKKTVRNVFKKGDAYFRSGDLLYKDKLGYHYFKDRMGDSYRWKSENVSTAEVEQVVSQGADLRDAVVFGVTVPHYDGKAGMAVIADPDGNMDLDKLTSHVNKTLPQYARPLFLRITKKIPMTGTHKLQKVELAKEGYDPTKTGYDKVYILLKESYVPFTKELETKLSRKEIKL